MSQVHVLPGPQTDFVSTTAKFPGYFAGRRSGKTTASVVKMVKYVTEHPGAYGVFTVPTLQDIDRILLPKMHELFGDLKGELWGHLEKKAQFVFPQHQGTVFLRTASEPDSLRGMTLAFAAMDEIGTEDQEEAFRILQPAVLGGQPGFPHQLWVTSTPNVQRPWVKKIWQDKIHPDTNTPLLEPDEYPIFRSRSLDNPYVAEEMKMLVTQAGTEAWARQEYEGEFIAVTGLAFPELSPDVHLRYPGPEVEFTRTVVGLDFGDKRPTALVEWRMDRAGRIWATSEFYKYDATDYDWLNWCAENNVKRLICDPVASEDDLTHWRRIYQINMNRAVAAISRSHEKRYKLWKNRLMLQADGLPGLFISPACVNLWEELQNLTHRKVKSRDDEGGGWTPGSSDHAYDAGAYGMSYFGRVEGRPTPSVVLEKVHA